MTSPLLALPGAVAGDGVDAPVAAHYGSLQRRAARARGGRRLRRPLAPRRRPHRGPGPADLAALLTTQHFLESLPAGVTWPGADPRPAGPRRARLRRRSTTARRSRPHTEPGRAAALVEFLERMKFMMRVELTDVTSRRRDLAAGARRGLRPLRAGPARPARVVRRGRRPRRRPVGLRGAADRPRRAPVRARHRRPHDPQRGRLDRLGRAHGQGLLPRPGDRRAGAHPRPAAAAADAAAPRRHREPAAPGRRRPAARGQVGRASSAPPPGTTSSARSRWRWSSATSTSTPSSRSTACRPPRRSWSTPRSGCTSARSADGCREVTKLIETAEMAPSLPSQ